MNMTGQITDAHEHANRAVQLNPYDAQNHRNLAMLKDALGDNQSALEHNMRSIALESDMLRTRGQAHPNTQAFRRAAVQIVAKGTGNYEEAHQLMDAARKIERKVYQLPTSSRTYEIISKINALKGNKEAEMAKDELAQKAKQKEVDNIKNGIMPGMDVTFKKEMLESSDE
jgi:tetratricopeptide (TPR) repeat protein